MGFLYLLHFDVPRFHAKHYLGSSEKLIERLTAHANGEGARLTHALWQDGEHWTLAAVFVPRPFLTAREMESLAKKQHCSPRFCPLCRPGQNIAPRGTMQVPVEHIHSETLERFGRKKPSKPSISQDETH